MEYTIGELAQKMNISTPTLRYYEDQGLLRHIKRLPNGRRVYTQKDVVMLNTIECLKKAGMSLQDISQYIDWYEEGFPSVQKRYELFVRKQEEIEQQIADLQKILATLRWKRNFYQKALESGELTICDADREKIAEAIIDDAL